MHGNPPQSKSMIGTWALAALTVDVNTVNTITKKKKSLQVSVKTRKEPSFPFNNALITYLTFPIP